MTETRADGLPTPEQYAALLTSVRLAGVYHLPAHGADIMGQAAVSLEYPVWRVDLAAVAGKESFLSALAEGMCLPEWFGHNWDALQDCLTDLSWAEADGYVLVLEHCDRFHGDAEADFGTALQILAEAADYWREEGVPFWSFIDMQADGIAFLPDLPRL